MQVGRRDLDDDKRDTVILPTENETKRCKWQHDQNHNKLQGLLWGKGPKLEKVGDQIYAEESRKISLSNQDLKGKRKLVYEDMGIGWWRGSGGRVLWRKDWIKSSMWLWKKTGVPENSPLAPAYHP